MLDWMFGKNRDQGTSTDRSVEDYEAAKEIATHGTLEERKELASDNELEPEFLYFFANDDSVDVRNAVANNGSTPLQADFILAKDPDQIIREAIAGKISSALPGLETVTNTQVVDVVFEALDLLAQDALPHIRGIVAESIKEMENVPKSLVSMLANDASDSVAVPVLEYSPLLTTEDLLDLIVVNKQDDRLCAISSRSALAADTSAAIVASGSNVAIIALLENTTAEIDDPSMNTIADRAENDESLHEPLALRPNLSERILDRVADMVSDTLILRIVERGNLGADQAQALRARVGERISDVYSSEGVTTVASEKVRALEAYHAGQLNGSTIMEAIGENRIDFVRYSLSLLAKVPASQVLKAFVAPSGELLVAIAWKCRLSMKVATTLQQKVAKLTPDKIVGANEHNDYPMSVSEMERLLEVVDTIPNKLR